MALADWTYVLLAMLPFVALAFGILYVGYVAYGNERIREVHAQRAPPIDPLPEMRRTNDEIAEGLARARATLEETRKAVARGTKG